MLWHRDGPDGGTGPLGNLPFQNPALPKPARSPFGTLAAFIPVTNNMITVTKARKNTRSLNSIANTLLLRYPTGDGFGKILFHVRLCGCLSIYRDSSHMLWVVGFARNKPVNIQLLEKNRLT
ncbi:hypothetical protein Hanom_Chr08g00691641 [Helianthus anomalus]